MSEQVLPQLVVVVVQLRARQEDFLQVEAQPVPGLSAEERRVPQRPVRHQRATDRSGADAGHCAPRPRRQGGTPAVLRHLPHAAPADLDDVVHPCAGEAEELADGEGRARHHMLDKRCVWRITREGQSWKGQECRATGANDGGVKTLLFFHFF